MGLIVYVVPAVCFGVIALAAYAAFAMLDPYWLRVRGRVEEVRHSGGAAAGGDASGRQGALHSKAMAWLQRIAPCRADERPRLQQRLTKAGIYRPDAAARYYTARVVLMVGCAGAVMGVAAMRDTSTGIAILFACVCGGVGAIAPSFWLDAAIRRHHLLLRKSLPDFLDLMTVCLEGGLSLQETIRRVGDELQLVHPALAEELTLVQRDVGLGATVDQALRRFATRSDYEGVRTLSTFIRESQRFGTNITEALRSHADMLRSQREQLAEENAQKAAVKILLPTMLLIFPAIFVVAVGPAVIQIQEAFASK